MANVKTVASGTPCSAGSFFSVVCITSVRLTAFCSQEWWSGGVGRSQGKAATHVCSVEHTRIVEFLALYADTER
jgi:hypothetical protein